MNDYTRERLRELEEATWFWAAGQKDTTAAFVVASWEEAVAWRISETGMDLLRQASLAFHERLRGASTERTERWNETVAELRPAIDTLIKRKIGATAGKYLSLHLFLYQYAKHPTPTFTRMVEWDMLLYAMEAENADVCAPGFHTEQAQWYLRGHFPCGRLGNMLTGKAIIF
jgi:hypothetical protein